MIPQCRNGFDTTSVGAEDSSLVNILDKENFAKTIKESSKEKERNFEVQALYYNVDTNSNDIYHTYSVDVYNGGESVVVDLKENVKLSKINKEILSNLFVFASKIEAKTLYIMINRKGKDYGK